MGFVERFAQRHVAERKVGAAPCVVVCRLGEAPDLAQRGQPDHVRLAFRVVLEVRDQHAGAFELARTKDRQILGLGRVVSGIIVVEIALQGVGRGRLAFPLDYQHGDVFVLLGDRVILERVEMIDEIHLLHDLVGGQVAAWVGQVLGNTRGGRERERGRQGEGRDSGPKDLTHFGSSQRTNGYRRVSPDPTMPAKASAESAGFKRLQRN